MLAYILLIIFSCTKYNKLVSNDDTSQGISIVEGNIYTANCKNEPLSIACNFEAIDDIGGTDQLYNYYGMPIVLDFSTMWCGPCNTAASEAQEIQDLYSTEGLVYITVLIENSLGDDPTADDLRWWVERYGLTTSPVWGSNRDILNNEDSTAGWFLQGWPTFWFLDENMKIQSYMRGYSEHGLIQGIDSTIN